MILNYQENANQSIQPEWQPLRNNKCWWAGGGEKVILVNHSWKYKLAQSLWKPACPQKLKTELPSDPALPFAFAGLSLKGKQLFTCQTANSVHTIGGSTLHHGPTFMQGEVRMEHTALPLTVGTYQDVFSFISSLGMSLAFPVPYTAPLFCTFPLCLANHTSDIGGQDRLHFRWSLANLW